MKSLAATFLLLIASFAIADDKPAPVGPEPKQSHFVVYILWCGYTQGVLITVNPPRWVEGSEFTLGMDIALIESALADNRVRYIALENRGCSEFPTRT